MREKKEWRLAMSYITSDSKSNSDLQQIAASGSELGSNEELWQGVTDNVT